MTHHDADKRNAKPGEFGTNGSHVDSNGSHLDSSRALTPWKPEVRDPFSGSRASTKSAAQPSGSLDPKAFLAALRRRWLVALSFGAACAFLAAVAAWYFVPAPYVAYSEVMIDSVPERIIFKTAESPASFSTYKQTKMRLVRSPFVLNAALRSPDVEKLSIVQQAEHPMEWIEEHVEVTAPATEFIRIELAGKKPQELTTIINAITDAYLEEVRNLERSDNIERKKKLERIRAEQEDKLQRKRTEIKTLAEVLHTSNTETLTQKQQMAVEYYGKLQQGHAQIKFQLMQAKAQAAGLAQSSDSPDKADIPDSVLDRQISEFPEVQRLEERIRLAKEGISRYERAITDPSHPTLQRKRDELLQLENDLHILKSDLRPTVIQRVHDELAAQSQMSADQLKKTIDVLTAQEAQLRQELESKEFAANDIGIKSYQLESLKETIAQIEDMEAKIADEIQRIEIELEAPPRVTLYRRAQVPFKPEMQRRYALTGLAGVGVFGFVIIGIVWLEYEARRISTLGEVVDGLSLRVLGSLPIMPRWMVQGRNRKPTVRSAAWQSVWTESIDSARTMLLRDASMESMTVIMVASAMGGEGKTTLTSHMATSMARAGRKTLLLDCDLRRPSLHKVFGMPLEPGFCELLCAEVDVEDAIQPTSINGLSLLPAGTLQPETLQLLAKGAAESLFELFKEEFDFVIVDSSPVLPVTDALLVGQHVDGVIFAIRRDISRHSKVATACQRLSMLGVPLLGAVVIGLEEGGYGYRSPYRYGTYGEYAYHRGGQARATPLEDE